MELSAVLKISESSFSVVPILVGPLQALIALLPAIMIAIGSLLVSLFKPSTLKKLLHLLWAQKVAVIIIALVIWGGVHLFSLMGRGTVSKASAGTGKTEWSLFRGSLDRRGSVPGAEDPASGKVNWSFSHEGIKTFYSSPCVVGNRLYATSARYEFFKNIGAIYSIDADTGKLVWAYQAGYRATFSSPSVSGKYLVVGEGLHFTGDSRVFCIDIEQSEKKREGVKLWSFRTKNHVESSPCIADGRAYVGAGSDGLYCFALEPDKNGNAQLLWHVETKDYPDCESSPVCFEGKVYEALGIDGQALVCFDGATGKELWKVKTPYPVFGSPSISNNKIYIGMGYGDFVNNADAWAGNLRLKLEKEGKSPAEILKAVKEIKPIGEVWCIDLKTQAIAWKFTVGDTVLGSAAIDGDKIYFGSRDKNIYCISTDGKLLHKWNAHAPLVTSPSIGDKTVYIVSDTGQIWGLDKKTFAPVWDISLNSPTMSSPCVARGHVYIGTTSNGLVCVGQPGGEAEKTFWAGSLGGSGRSGWLDGSLLPLRGEYAWGYPGAPKDAEEKLALIRSPGAFLKGAFYIAANQGNVFGLAKLKSGEKTGTAPVKAWFAPAKNPVYLSAAANEDAVFFVDGRAADKNRALHCLDQKSGKELWQYGVGDGSGEFIITKEKLIIAATAKELACLDIKVPAVKKELWRSETGSVAGVPAFTADIVITAAVKAKVPELAALDLETGIKLWAKPLASAPKAGPVFTKGLIWVGGAAGIESYELLDGKQASSIKCGAVASPLVCNLERLACVTSGGEVVVVDTEKGKEIARITDQKAVGGYPPLLLEDMLLYGAKEAILAYDLKAQKSVQWAKIRASWPGIMTTPMIMVDSSVYFATDKEGFICLKPKTK